jgi:hypothetical protein
MTRRGGAVRRIVFLALAGTLACNEVSKQPSGPGDRFYRPVGMGVREGKLLVASSNADLRYDSATGGSVIAVDPGAASADPSLPPLVGSVNIESFAGELAIATKAACPDLSGTEDVVLVPVRGADLLYVIRADGAGALAVRAAVALSGGTRADPFAVGVACAPGLAKAYLGYLRATDARGWLTEIDLAAEPPTVRHVTVAGSGQLRGFAFDAPRRRLYATQAAVGGSTVLHWFDLAGGCAIDLEPSVDVRGCARGSAAAPAGVELRGIALARDTGPVRRVYLTGKVYDPDALGVAADAGGVLLVADLVEDLSGLVRLDVVRTIEMGYGGGPVALLPRSGPERDLVAALATTSGELLVYDDESGRTAALTVDPATGAPVVGRGLFGLAVDPVAAGADARVYVGSFQQDLVLRLRVPLDPLQDPAPEILGSIVGGTP